MARAGFKAYADSLRRVRRENGGEMPALEPVDYAPSSGTSLDPFAHTRLMEVVERNMQRLIAGEQIHVKSVNGMVPDDPAKVYPAMELTDYEQILSTDRLLKYRVSDRASGKSFDILFPIYGGLISGWDVRPVEQ